MLKTKIVCTIGPASDSPEILEKLILAGMNVARLNFSHGTHDEHKNKIKIIRNLSEKLKKPIAILQDLCGPKIRVGIIPAPGITLIPGQDFILTNEDITGNNNKVSVSYKNLPSDVKIGDKLLLADGRMELHVKETNKSEILCKVITGGLLTSHKGVNLPSGTITAPILTEKDLNDLYFGLEHDVDYVGLSFVKDKNDILKVKEIIKNKGKDTPVIAKIERHEALANIDGIIDATDGIMVARGDLGVDIPLETVPNIQKMLIDKSNAAGKPVIVATQMLMSMVNSPIPTRAEATDVANGVLEGADAVMLSEETASGNYPVEAVTYMAKIALNAEINFPHEKYLDNVKKENLSEAIAYASSVLVGNLDAQAVVATTQSGKTAMSISKFRPKHTIICLSPSEKTVRKLALYWGCISSYINFTKDTEEMIKQAAQSTLATGIVKKGDQIVITAGYPLWTSGTTNLLWVKDL